MKIFSHIICFVFIITVSSKVFAAEDYTLDNLKDEFQDLNAQIIKDIKSLPEAVSDIEKDFDDAIRVLQQGIGFLSAAEVDFATVDIFDQLTVFDELTSNIAKTLPDKFNHNMEDLNMNDFSEEETSLLATTMADMKRVKLDAAVELTESINRINNTSVRIEQTLDKLEAIGEEFAILDFERFKENMAKEMSVDMDAMLAKKSPGSSQDNSVVTSEAGPVTSDLSQATTKVTDFSSSTTAMTTEVSEVTAEVSEVTTEVSQVTEEVAQVTEQVTEATEEVSQVVEEVAAVTEEVSQVAEQVTEVTEEVTQAVVEQVTEVTEEISQVVEQVAEITQEIEEVAQEIAQASEEISEATSSLSEEAQIIADWISSQNLADTFVTNLKDQWGRAEYNFNNANDAFTSGEGNFTGIYSAVQESTAALEALASTNEDITCSGDSCTFESFYALKEWEDFSSLAEFCASNPESHQGHRKGVSGEALMAEDCY